MKKDSKIKGSPKDLLKDFKKLIKPSAANLNALFTNAKEESDQINAKILKQKIQSNNISLDSGEDNLIKANKLLVESYSYSEAIIATIHEPTIILNVKFRVKSASDSFYKKFNTTKEESIGVSLFELSNKQWNIHRLKRLLKEVLQKNKNFDNFEMTHTFQDMGEKILLLNAHSIIQNNGEQLILLSIEDITERTHYHLKEKELLNNDISIHKADKQELEKAVKRRTRQLEQKNKEAEAANKELAFQNQEKEKRAAELIIANNELAFQNQEKEKRAAELSIANKELTFQNQEKEKRAAELSMANEELAFQNDEKEKRDAELIIANYARSLIEASLDPLVTISAEGKITDVNEASIKVTGVPREKLIDTDFSNYFTEPEKAQEGYRQVFEKGFVSDYPLTIRHKNGNLTDVLYNASVYKDDKGNVLGVFAAARDVTEQKWAIDLRIANKELAFQNEEKEKRAAELIIANKELAFQNDEKEKRAQELSIANKELAFQNNEKEKRAAELIIANEELAFQNNEKEKRAAELIIANQELAYQNEVKEKRAAELIIANKELAFQNEEKEKRAAELIIANEELAFQNNEKEKRAAELIIANEELAFQNNEKEKRAAELSIANKELAFQNEEKEKRAAELSIANKELAFQNNEKEKRAAELSIANEELTFQNDEKEKRAAELIIANKELAFQNDEKEKRAAELIIANKELAFQNDEKEKRAQELSIANKELAFQNDEKEKRAAELIIANKELAFQNNEKEKRAAELSIANEELTFQNDEKEKRAAELIIANKELAFQNDEKEKRAAELIIANKELAFQNDEKEKRAAELIIANKELTFQNEEKEKRAAELSIANQDLTSFTYVSSHDLQEPLRKIQNFVSCILLEETNLSDTGKDYFNRMANTAKRMQCLIEDLLTYSRTKSNDRKFETVHLNSIIEEVVSDFEVVLKEKKAVITILPLGEAHIISFQFRQLAQNLISNSLKFSIPGKPPEITIKSKTGLGSSFDYTQLLPDSNYINLIFIDNGIGFDPQYKDRIFEVFQRLHTFDKFAGTGIGLAICKRIVENHNGFIAADSKLGEGVRFDIFLPI